jgi:AbrB family looped-hinge helix DNA binding protein
MPIVAISPKGQVTIPKEVRKALAIQSFPAAPLAP